MVVDKEKFQFRKGPIERKADETATVDFGEFQFQKRPIESMLATSDSPSARQPEKFQFQKGPIESST